jgi:hypothetical protein
MALLRVGQLTLNLDQVTVIRDLSPQAPHRGGLRIEFQGGQRIEIVNEAECDPLRAWILANAQSIAS